MLPAGKGLNYLPRLALSSARFSLWVLVPARVQTLAEESVCQAQAVLRSPSGEHVFEFRNACLKAGATKARRHQFNNARKKTVPAIEIDNPETQQEEM